MDRRGNEISAIILFFIAEIDNDIFGQYSILTFTIVEPQHISTPNT